MVTAIIQPTRLEQVKDALGKVGVYRLTVSDVQGYARGAGPEGKVYRGHNYEVSLVPLVKVEVAVNEAFVEPAVQAIAEAGRLELKGDGSEAEDGHGDGKIFIEELDDVVRIRTGERGPEAI